MDEKKEKQGLNNELDEKRELSDEELDQATGGTRIPVNDDEDIIIDTTPYRVK